MPRLKHDYPPDWDETAWSIKEREGWCCKDCGVEQGAFIVRPNRDDQSYWRYATEEDRGRHKIVKVVLSVHHIGTEKADGTPGDPNDKFDCRPENLEALCSRCHLVKDIGTHVHHARDTRIFNKRQAQLEAGQGELF